MCVDPPHIALTVRLTVITLNESLENPLQNIWLVFLQFSLCVEKRFRCEKDEAASSKESANPSLRSSTHHMLAGLSGSNEDALFRRRNLAGDVTSVVTLLFLDSNKIILVIIASHAFIKTVAIIAILIQSLVLHGGGGFVFILGFGACTK